MATGAVEGEAEARQIRRRQARPVLAHKDGIIPAILRKRREATQADVSLLGVDAVQRDQAPLMVDRAGVTTIVKIQWLVSQRGIE
jgi:hypothetical protein